MKHFILILMFMALPFAVYADHDGCMGSIKEENSGELPVLEFTGIAVEYDVFHARVPEGYSKAEYELDAGQGARARLYVGRRVMEEVEGLDTRLGTIDVTPGQMIVIEGEGERDPLSVVLRLIPDPCPAAFAPLIYTGGGSADSRDIMVPEGYGGLAYFLAPGDGAVAAVYVDDLLIEEIYGEATAAGIIDVAPGQRVTVEALGTAGEAFFKVKLISSQEECLIQ